MGTTPHTTVDGGTSLSPDTNFLAWLDGMRVEHDLSWAEVSRRSGISENGLRKIRQGEVVPRPATMQALGEVFGLSAERDLVGLTMPAPGGDLLAPIPARRGDSGATTYLTVGVAGARAHRLDRDGVGRLIAFLEASARAWLMTADCTERD